MNTLPCFTKHWKDYRKMEKLKPISKHGKDNFAIMFGRCLKEAWYFDKLYEKIILIIMGILAMVKITEVII